MPLCPHCGTDNHDSLETCMYCHKPLKKNKQTFESFSTMNRDQSSSDLNGIALLLLFIFLPTAHYVYVNKIGLAILFFITGCSEKETKQQEKSIYGTWKLASFVNQSTNNILIDSDFSNSNQHPR